MALRVPAGRRAGIRRTCLRLRTRNLDTSRERRSIPAAAAARGFHGFSTSSIARTPITIAGRSRPLAQPARACSWWDSLPECTAPTGRCGRLRATTPESCFTARCTTRTADTGPSDGLRLRDPGIRNAVKCLQPGNKPEPDEVIRCNRYLVREIDALLPGDVIVALGRVAHGAILKALSLKPGTCRFAHGAEYRLPGGRMLLDSYHCSRLNTNTGRLTPAMFRRVFARARHLIAG